MTELIRERQQYAIANPCARAKEILGNSRFRVVEDGLVSIFTVNK
jgi:hypothetical protein